MDALAERFLGHKPIAFADVAGSGAIFVGFARAPLDKATEYAAEKADVDAAAVAGAEAPPRRRACDDGLRDAGAAAGRGAGAHGAARHRRSTATCCRGSPAISRRAWRGSRTRSAGSSAGRSTPARRSSSATFCSARWACPAARRPRPAPGRPRRACSRTSPPRATNCRRACSNGGRSSKLKSTYADALPGFVNPSTGRVHTSYALAATTTGRLSSSEPEPAEHSGPHRGRPQDPPRLRRAEGPQADLGRLQPDRVAPARPYRRHSRAEAGLRRGARHPRDDRLGDVRRSDRTACRAKSAAAPRRSISASSTASRPSASPTSSASRARRRAPTSASISSASPASATTWRRPRRPRAPTAM